jgi:hypothetical protein
VEAGTGEHPIADVGSDEVALVEDPDEQIPRSRSVGNHPAG